MGKSTKDIYGAEAVGSLIFMDPDKVLVVGLDKGAPDVPELEDKERIDAPSPGLVQSIRTHGWRGGAITIRKVGEAVVAVDGRQRIMACRIIKAEQVKAGADATIRVKCTIDEATNLSGSMGTKYIQNEHRRDLTPLQRARGTAEMLANGYDIPSILATFNISRQTYYTWKKVLTLPEDILAYVSNGQLPMATAAVLADLPSAKEQREALKEALEGGSGDDDADDDSGDDDADEPTKEEVRRRIKAKASGGADDGKEAAKPWGMSHTKELLDLCDPAQNANDDEKVSKAEETAERLAWALLSVLRGENKTASRLKDWPRLQRWAKECAPRPKAKKAKAEGK